MSNEKLEALKLGLLVPWDRQGIDTNRRIDAAHALGVEEGKREAEAKAEAKLDTKHAKLVKVADELAYARREVLKLDAENKRLRKEAAPVDDGRNWEIVDRDGCVTVASRPLVELLHHVVSSLTLGWTARPVEPKHVHEWGQVYLDGHRNCLHCDARQVAEWKDEVTK